MGPRRRPHVLRLMPVLDFGGVESRVVLQASAAADAGYELRVCTFTQAGAAARTIRESGVPVDVLGIAPSLRSPRATRRLYRYLRDTAPDIVHSSISEANVHGLVAGALARVPVRIAEEVGVPDHSPRARVVMRGLYRLASRIVGVTDATCDYLVETDGAPARRVQRIYNCAHPRYFPTTRAPTERARGAGPLRVLAVGRLHPVKNHLRLIEAFQRVLQEGIEAELTIVGSGPLESELRREIAARSLSSRVHLPGFRDDVRPLLLSSHLYTLPSQSEGCSISLIEALATGLPAVGSDVPGVHEVLGADLAREAVFDPHDVHAMANRIRAMLSRPDDELTAFARACQDRVYRDFSPTAYLQNLERLYADTWIEALPTSGKRNLHRSL